MLIVNFYKPETAPPISIYLIKLISAFIASFDNACSLRGAYIEACCTDPCIVGQVNNRIAAIAGTAIGNIPLAQDAANLLYVRQLYTNLLAGLVASGAERSTIECSGFRLPINYIRDVSPTEMKITFWS